MKFSRNELFFLFCSFALGGIGLLQPINQIVGYTLAIIGIIGMIAVLIKRRIHLINIFPLLNITALEKWAIKISDHYNYIKTIILYEAPFVSHKKYILFFDFDTSTVKGRNSKGTFDGHTWFNKWSKKNYPIDDSFREVYKEKPPDDFFKEWLITTEKPQGVNKRLSLILYNKKDT